jgi:hypothetical protein
MGLLIVWLLALAEDKPTKPAVVAMVLQAGPGATLQRGKETAKALRDMDLLYEGDTLKAGKEPVRVVFLDSGQGERLLPSRKAIVGKVGCAPKEAVEKLKTRLPDAARKKLYRFLTGERAGVAALTGRRPACWPIHKSVVVKQRPTFRWAGIEGAVKYELEVTTGPRDKPVVVCKETTAKTVLPYPEGKAEPQRGKTYQWTVKAILADGESEYVVERTEFTVASAKLKQELEELAPLGKSKAPDDWLLAAQVYESEACFGMALPLYEKLARKRPRQGHILMALRDLYAHYQKDEADKLTRRLRELGYRD